MATEREIRDLVAFARQEEQWNRKMSDERCDCSIRSNDMKGPCGHCTNASRWCQIANDGERILGLDLYEFHAEGDAYIKRFPLRRAKE